MFCQVNLSDVAAEIRDGDLLLFRGRGLVARMIGVAGRSNYTHAARAVWWGNDLFCCEVRELKGGRAVTLESQTRKFAGLIDVFEVNPSARWREFDRHGAVRYIRRLAGCDYGYRGVLLAALEFAKLLAAAETRGFHGTASITVSVQDGHIQHLRVAVDRIVR